MLFGCQDVIVDPDEPPGRVYGVVEDQFGARIPGASVAIPGAPELATVTDQLGQYTLDSVPAGDYPIAVTKSGFRDDEQRVVVASGQSTLLTFSLRPESRAFAAVLGTRMISLDPYAGLVLEADIAVVDQDAQAIPLLGPTDFALANYTSNPSFPSLVSQQSVQPVTGGSRGPFSALMLMDQSGSIAGTDPLNSRLQAGKIFFSALGPGDQVQLAAFAESGSLPFSPITLYGPGFTTNGQGYYGNLDALANQVGGGTPLYLSTYGMIGHTATNAPTSNKAVVVFTDGDDTQGGATIDDIANRCTGTGVRVFMVGLGTGISSNVLSEIASRCGGGVMRADDARQLVAMYGSLGAMLNGAVTFYRTRWLVTIGNGGCFCGYPRFTANVQVQVPGEGQLSAPLYLQLP
jgi:hypothetical protein